MISNKFKPVIISLAVAIGALALVACGSDSADPATAVPAAATSVPSETSAAPTTVSPAATTAPPADTATAVPPVASPTSPPPATAEPTVEPTATPALDTVYSDYGFTLNLDLGADVQSAGYSEATPSETQGVASFVYSGVTVGLVWSASNSKTPLEFVANSYNDIQAAQPGINFESIAGGDITVSEQVGSFGGFKALDGNGNALGGGLIGAWNCANDIAYRMTLTGADATVVQLRFDRMLENFTCPS